MNPEDKRSEREERITALLLGELPPAEAAELTAAIEADPELRRLRDRLRLTMDLVREATSLEAVATSASPVQPRLTGSRRSELLKRFRTVDLRPAVREQSWRWAVTIAAAAGLTLVLSVLSLSVGSTDRGKAWRAAVLEWSDEHAAARKNAETRLADSLQKSAGRAYAEMGTEVEGTEEQTRDIRSFTRTSQQLRKLTPSEPGYQVGRSADRSEALISQLGTGVRQETGKSIEDMEWTPALGMPDQQPAMRFGLDASPRPAASAPVELRVEREAEMPFGTSEMAAPQETEASAGLPARPPTLRPQGPESPSSVAPAGGLGGAGVGVGGGRARGLAEAERARESGLGRLDDRLVRGGEPRTETFSLLKEEGGQAVGEPAAIANGVMLPPSLQSGAPAGAKDQSVELGDQPTVGRFFESQDGMTGWAAGANLATADPRPGNVNEMDLNGSVERYESKIQLGQAIEPGFVATNTSSALYFSRYSVPASGEPVPRQKAAAVEVPEPQPEVQTAEQPISTFSLNVSDVSFKLAAASLGNGVMPEPATIRSEEFINALDYRDPEPAPGAAVALAWERARYPFAHNRDLLRLSVKTAAQGREQDRPLNLVLLLDSSGSMERADRVRIIREAMHVLSAQLQPQDRVSVVSFARTPRLWVDGLAGSEAAALVDLVGELAPEGGTNLEEALGLAYETAARHFVAEGVNRVVLLTDGAANLGDVEPRSLQGQVESNRLRNIALDCFGIGWDGYNDELLEALSRHGDGRYGFVNSTEEAASGFANQLAGALQIAAANVKVQVEFNPARVSAYRQIGYAKHQLTEEQFRDDSVDAAEIGAAESGNALYLAQIEANGQGPIGTVRARYQDPANGDVREREWVLPYLGPAPALEVASGTLRLAGAAAAFAEWLGRSPFAGEVTTDRLLQLLDGVPEAFEPDPRPQQLREMILQGTILAGGTTN